MDRRMYGLCPNVLDRMGAEAFGLENLSTMLRRENYTTENVMSRQTSDVPNPCTYWA